MRQKIFSILASCTVATLLLGAQASAASQIGISVAAAYPKGNGSYDVVVKDTPGTKLALYVNDKNPTRATVNKSDWATFHKVQLTTNSKISFTRQLKANNKQYEKPINYVRYFTTVNSKPGFSLTKSTTATALKTVAPTPQPTPAPVPAASTCTNGSYVNSAGNTVCSPEAASSQPPGAAAQCVDGTYSFSQSRSGTCSHHGGVSVWY